MTLLQIEQFKNSEMGRLVICKALKQGEMTIKEISELIGENTSTTNYRVNSLIDAGCVAITNNASINKKYSLTEKPFIPKYLAINIDEIVSIKDVPKSNKTVYLNSQRHSSDYKWQSKKHTSSTMQSSMQSWSNA
jgi:predicted transcriptional regulator